MLANTPVTVASPTRYKVSNIWRSRRARYNWDFRVDIKPWFPLNFVQLRQLPFRCLEV